MSQPQSRSSDPLRKAIGKLVLGLERRSREQHNQRRHHRFNFGVKVLLCSKSGNHYQTLCEAWAVDLSIGGIGCLAEQDDFGQDVLYVSFEEVIGRPCYIPIRVKHCKSLIGNVRHLHGEFVFPEDLDEMRNDVSFNAA